MEDRLVDVARRRGELLAEIRQQRVRVAALSQPLAGVLGKVDRVGAAIHWLKTHPAAVAVSVAAMVVSRPRKLWGLAKRSFALWRGWSSLRRRFLPL